MSKRAKSHDPNSDSRNPLLVRIRLNETNLLIDAYSLFGVYLLTPATARQQRRIVLFFSCILTNMHQNKDYFNN